MTVEPNALDFNADHPPTVVLRISRADATRIVRALDETSLSIGVAPGGFNGVDPVHTRMDFWVPLQNRPAFNAWGAPPADYTLYGSPNWLALDMLGRLQPGISPEQAAAQLTPAFRNTLARAWPDSRANWRRRAHCIWARYSARLIDLAMASSYWSQHQPTSVVRS